MKLTEVDAKELRRREESLWRPEIRCSTEAMDALLDDSFVEIGASGRVYDKRQALDAPIQEINAQLPLPDFSARLLASSVALVTYRSVQMNADGSRREARRSSLWTKKGGSWRIVFHQGTLLR